MPKRYFVTAIGTDSGKTIASAILVKALGAEYWKPIQSGEEIRDTDTIKTLVPTSKFHKEAYLLKEPMSPHAAARIDGVSIDMSLVKTPDHTQDLVIEGAGGLMVPLNDYNLIADLIPQFECETVLVSNLYLGSINHTLLSINELKRRRVAVKGIIFNGDRNQESVDFILKYSGYRELLQIEREAEINLEVIEKYAEKLKQNWK